VVSKAATADVEPRTAQAHRCCFLDGEAQRLGGSGKHARGRGLWRSGGRCRDRARRAPGSPGGSFLVSWILASTGGRWRPGREAGAGRARRTRQDRKGLEQLQIRGRNLAVAAGLEVVADLLAFAEVILVKRNPMCDRNEVPNRQAVWMPRSSRRRSHDRGLLQRLGVIPTEDAEGHTTKVVISKGLAQNRRALKD